jgi:hypothetical protein
MHNDCEPNSSAVPQSQLHALRDQGLAVVAMRTSPDSSEIIVFVESSAAEYSKVVTIDINEV